MKASSLGLILAALCVSCGGDEDKKSAGGGRTDDGGAGASSADGGASPGGGRGGGQGPGAAGGSSNGGSSGSGTTGGNSNGAGGTSDAGTGGIGTAGGGGVPPDGGSGGAPEGGDERVTVTVFRGFGPVANVPVIVDGATYVTGQDGTVTTTESVPPRYDATVIDQVGGATSVFVMRGLATRTPLIVTPGGQAASTARIAGRLSGGAGFPNPALHRAGVAALDPRGFLLEAVNVPPAAGPEYLPFDVAWAESGGLDVTLLGLQWTMDADFLPTTYHGFARKTLLVSDGGAFGSPAADLALSAVSERVLRGTVTVQDSLPSLRKIVRVGGVQGIQPVNHATDTAAFSYTVPSGLPVPSTFHAVAGEADGPAAHSIVLLKDTTTDLDVEMLHAPVQVLPVANATGVNEDTAFTFTAQSTGVYDVAINDDAGTLFIDIWTTETTVKVPDLSGAGISLSPGGYAWTVTVHGPTHDTDDLVDTVGLFDIYGARADAFTAIRRFSVAP